MTKEKVLIVGGGGREFAAGKKFAESEHVEEVFFLAEEDNATCLLGKNVPIKPSEHAKLKGFVEAMGIGLTWVGPEGPLVEGIVDHYHESGMIKKGHYIVGPTAAAAQLEGSKSFAKEVMVAAGIPTADSQVFDDPEMAIGYVRETYEDKPVVIKADGLAFGKGVTVCKNANEAEVAINAAMIEGAFKDAGKVVVIEDFLEGEEASVLAFTDGESIVELSSSQDHKPVDNNDKGPNTGGMGAYAPAPVATPAIASETRENVLVRAVDEMRNKGTPYTGCLYAGLMIDEGPKVVEFNCRMGDPETQPVLALLDSDFFEFMMATARGELSTYTPGFKEGHACLVVMASNGYPGKYQKGQLITGIDAANNLEGVTVIPAGVAIRDGKPHNNGGRSVGILGEGESLEEATDRAYEGADFINWGDDDGGDVHLRDDIGKKGIARYAR